MKVHILDEAEQDIINSFRFYEAQQEGLGDYFLDSLFSDIDSLQFYAGIHPKRFAFHRLLSKRFPFAIYYKVKDETAKVWAVLDCRQIPSIIEERLTSNE